MGLTPLTLLTSIIGSMLMAFNRPIFGVVAYLIVYFCLDPWAWYGRLVQKTLLGRPAMVVALVLILACFLNHRRLWWRFTKREIAIYSFILLVVLISYLFGVGINENSAMYIEKIIKLGIFIFFFIRCVTSFQNLKIIIWVILGSGIFLAYQAHLVTSFTDGRMDTVGGVDFHDANALGAFLMFCIVLLGFKLFRMNLLKKIVIVALIAFMMNAFIMTQSRAVFMGMVPGFIFVLLNSSKKIKKEIFLYASLAVVLLFSLTHEAFWARMGSINEQSKFILKEQSVFDQTSYRQRTRLDFWRSSIDIFKDYPMGIGIKNFETIVQLYDPGNVGMDAHNTYVLCYSEIGILGIILFLIISFGALFQLRRVHQLSKHSEQDFEIQMLTLSLSTFLVIYMTGPMVTHSYLYSEFTWILLVLPICLENAVKNIISSENNTNSNQ